jgi:hypothetical protein
MPRSGERLDGAAESHPSQDGLTYRFVRRKLSGAVKINAVAIASTPARIKNKSRIKG